MKVHLKTLLFFLLLFLSYHLRAQDSLVANFGYDYELYDCQHRVSFYDSSFSEIDSVGILKRSWDFGDGYTDSVSNPVHDYVSPGVRIVTLFVLFDNLDWRMKADTVVIVGKKAKFIFDDYPTEDTIHVCKGDLVKMKNISSGKGEFPSYEFHWGNGAVTNPGDSGWLFDRTYQDTGVYNVYLIVEDDIKGTNIRCSNIYPENKMDKVVHVHSSAAEPEFQIMTNPTFIGHPTAFVPLYRSHDLTAIWNFGDNTILEMDEKDSFVIHKYQQLGSHRVTLTYIEEFLEYGLECSASDTQFINVLSQELNSVNELSSQVVVSPNPSSGLIELEFSEYLPEIKVVIYNSQGLQIEDLRYLGAHEILLDLEVAKGLYFMDVYSENELIFRDRVLISK
ncbi:hypothetical protein GYB22_04520 [bacterium]|nr:hypothetical protein [bacterium]